MNRARFWGALSCVGALLSAAAPAVRGDLVVYSDALGSGWNDWSWDGVSRDLTSSTPLHSGAASIGVTYTGAWSGLQLGRLAVRDVSGYDAFRCYVNGGNTGGQQIEIQVGNNNTGVSVTLAITPVAGTWTQIDIPLWDLGNPAQ